MKVFDPGHRYGLVQLDSPENHLQGLIFVKRLGEQYPGNVGPTYPGTTIQEILRACIDRLQYVNGQIYSRFTSDSIGHLRTVINLLEIRAAERHGAKQPQWDPKPELHPVESNGHWKFEEKGNG